MSRIKNAALIAGRTLTRTPLPDFAYEALFGKVRISLPTDSVKKKHAIDVELVSRTRVVWLDKHKAHNGIIVYLHGGGYISGPFVGDWQWLSEQVDARECAGLVIDYRYGPDYVHPTALDDTTEAIRGLSADGVLTSNNWVLVGHQSGAGLALALVNRANEELDGGIDQFGAKPRGLVLMNPWLDLELSNVELTETGEHDPVHGRRIMQLSAKKYAGRTPLDDPALSPINGNLKGLPPVHLSVGSKDVFLTDCRVVKLQFEREGVDLSYREVPGRITVSPRLRRGDDMQRLQAEQAAFIRDALA